MTSVHKHALQSPEIIIHVNSHMTALNWISTATFLAIPANPPQKWSI